MKLRLALLITALVPAPVLANYCAAPLTRGNVTIGSGGGASIVNTYYPVTADIVSGNQVQVGASFGANEDLRVGDIVLLWINQTMQYHFPANQNARNPDDFGDQVTGRGWLNLNHSGKFQWLRVSGSNGGTSPPGTIVKSAGHAGTTVLTVTNGAGQGTYGTLQLAGQTTLRSAQLIRVPQYGNVTISGTLTAEPYRNTVNSGTTGPQAIGGIVALDVAGAVTFAGGSSINVSNLGFRGGAGQRLDGMSVSTFPLTQTSRWYANPGTSRATGGIKGEGGGGTPHRVYFQSAESANLDYTGTGSVGAEGYGNVANPAGYGRGAPGNAGGGGTDQCPYNTNTGVSSTVDTMCRINTITYGYSRLNTGGGGGAGAGSGGQGGDHDYDGTGGTGTNVPSGGGLGGVGVSSFSLFSNDPPNPGGNHQYAMIGGGGGAGSTNAAGTDDLQSSGATGGGAVLIRAGSVSGSGSILADGQAAQDVTAVDPVNPGGINGAGQGNGAGGGGGGGWILISANASSSPSLSYSAKGGKGGNANKCMGSGGGGGGGYIGVSTTMPSVGSSAVTGGAAGVTSCSTPVSTDLPNATGLGAGRTAVGASAAFAGANGSTGQFPATGLSVPSTLANPGQVTASSSSVATGPQCVPLLKKEFSSDGGTTWLPAITRAANQVFKMRISLQNVNEDNFISGNTQPQVFDDINFVDTYGAGIVNATPPNIQQSGCNAASITATAGQNTLTVTSSGAVSGQTTCTIIADLTTTANATNTIAANAVTVSQLKQVVGDANKLVLSNFEPVTASVTVPTGVQATKTSAVVSDPVNNTTNPKRIPGASVDYTIAITNPAATVLDNNTMIMSDSLPTTTRFFVGNLTGGAPFEFTPSTSNLTCPFVSLADQNDCIDFSTDGADWTYVPTPAGDNTDAAIRFVRFRTTGSMAATSNFSVRYRVVVK